MKARSIDLGASLEAAFAASENGDESAVLGLSATQSPGQEVKQVSQEPKVSQVTEIKSEVKQFESTPVVQEVSKIEIEENNNLPLSTDLIKRIVSIYDDYNKLDPLIQKTMRAFLRIDMIDVDKIIYAVLNSTISDITGLNDVVELRQQEGVTRAFSLMTLDEGRLSKLHDLVTMFAKEYTQTEDVRLNKVKFCQNLERGIATLPEKAMEHLTPISELLRKGRL